MPKAVVLRETGGPEVLKIEDIPAPKDPQPGQVLIRHTAIGINYADIYYRKGIYKAPSMPMVPGMEACGVVVKKGEGVEVEVGQRVAYGTAKSGAYSEKRLINVRNLVAVPDEISDDIAAAALSKGMTAHMLLFRTFRVKKGDIILVHAAAGGVGQFLCQWASHLGAVVIGTVSSAEKAQTAKSSGCRYPIIYTEEDFVKEVDRITKGKGVNVVYDSVGKDTFQKSLQCLTPLGLMASYGQSSGVVPAFNVLSLANRGLFVTRPTLALYKSARLELVLTAREVFKQISAGVLRVNIGRTYNLADAAQAHMDLESRMTRGPSIFQV